MNFIFENWKEFIGYLAPLFVILSMTRSHLKEVRIYMIFGCITFIVYAILIQAWPVAIANGMIGGVTLFYFCREQKLEREYSINLDAPLDSHLFSIFVQKYHHDIQKKFPEGIPLGKQFFIFYETEIAGFAVQRSDGAFTKYLTPAHRDHQSEQWIEKKLEGDGDIAIGEKL